MSDNIKVYCDFEYCEDDEGGVGLNITIYPTKEKENLLEYDVDEQLILNKIDDLVEYAESVDDLDFLKFKPIYEKNKDEWRIIVFNEMKRLGKIKDYLCDAFNGDCDIEDWESVFPALDQMMAKDKKIQ